MKQIVAVILGFILILLAPPIKAVPDNLYPESMIVVEVDRERDVVTAQDCVGFLWEFTGCEDWHEGDIAACIMDSMGTELIFDDEIVKVRYCGWVY